MWSTYKRFFFKRSSNFIMDTSLKILNMKINSIILGAYYSCQANNYADMKVCINTYFVNTNRNISLKKKILDMYNKIIFIMMLLLMISCNSKQKRNHKNSIEIKEQLGQSSYPFIKSMEYHAYIQDNEAIPVIDIQITEKGNFSIFVKYQTNKKYSKLSYKETLDFLSTVIEKQNKENIPLSRLQQIFIRTEMWNENSIYTSMEEYRNINIPHGEYFNKKAKESRIVSDITKILSRYNLKIGSLSYEGLLPLDGKVIKEINKNIELNTSEAYLTGNLVLDIANQ